MRSADDGMSHSNMGLEPLVETGLPVSVSQLFARPSYQETAEVLTRRFDVAVGIHLTLNTDRKHDRSRPVSGRGAVLSIV